MFVRASSGGKSQGGVIYNRKYTTVTSGATKFLTGVKLKGGVKGKLTCSFDVPWPSYYTLNGTSYNISYNQANVVDLTSFSDSQEVDFELYYNSNGNQITPTMNLLLEDMFVVDRELGQ